MKTINNRNTDIAQHVLTAVGGENNVNHVSHCATRLRFNLKDEAKANTAALEEDPDVTRVICSGGQYQVVIGTHVAEVYEQLLEHSSLGQENTPKNFGKKENVLNRLISIITAIFTPFIGAFAAAGIVKGFLTLTLTLGWMTPESGAYTVLFSVADGAFTFLPVLLAFTAAKKFGTNQFTAVCLALALLHPSITAAATKAASTAGMEEAYNLDFFGIPVVLAPAGYASSVIPIILAVLVQSYVERFFRRIIPTFLQLIFVPLGIFLIVAPLTFVVLGPLGTIIGEWLGKGYNSVYALSPLIAGAVMGGLWEIFVMFGMHWGFVPIIALNLQHDGSDTILPLLLPAILAQGGAALAVFFRTKNTKLKELSGSSALTPAFGITEPTIYGVNLPLKRPFIAGCIGGTIGGAVVGVMGANAFANGLVSLLSLPTFIPTDNPQNTSGMFAAIIGTAIAFAVAFALTLILGFDDKSMYKNDPKAEHKINEDGDIKKPIMIPSPIQGKVVALSSMDDQTFSSGACGAGIAVKPTQGRLYAPADGTLTMVFPTGHAIGLTTAEGIEILMHVGTDTVLLNGDGFEVYVTQEAQVKKGELLVVFDTEKIKKAGLSDVTAIVITNNKKYADVSATEYGEVKVGDPLLEVHREHPQPTAATEKYVTA